MQLPSASLVILFLVLIIVSIILFWGEQSCSKISSIFSGNCHLSLSESDDFICEPDNVWNERKNVYRAQDKENMMKRQSNIFFLTNWEPNFHCSHARRVGRMGDGGKWVCDPYRLKSRLDCLVYSVGSNGDFSFEVDMKKTMPHCEIHTFDQNRYVCPKDICIFHQITFGNGTHPPGSKSWTTIIQELNHVQRKINVLKIDIEGGEYFFFPLLMQASANSLPQQILVELHPIDPNMIHGFFELLRERHYVIFNKEPNLIAGHRYFEYAFLKLNPLFFKSLPASSGTK
ncbi:unnamed protein product [Rotaria sp. Silwood2]|nr:unnamed protein product [Rotaria sp. Silwood2]CAF3090124.1 unnamed protein product [Rotaria sp. Silwood2]CAF3277318.1 unnamed protein product [Rotaria sp. Silwood2]CAF4321254.1 unnamed protein product [Rotaria sp. Silwood2]CAF4406961.1 unnamed protein product [Rotaria sp. Silwood2]